MTADLTISSDNRNRIINVTGETYIIFYCHSQKEMESEIKKVVPLSFHFILIIILTFRYKGQKDIYNLHCKISIPKKSKLKL